jgi:hypothetical protein
VLTDETGFLRKWFFERNVVEIILNKCGHTLEVVIVL